MSSLALSPPLTDLIERLADGTVDANSLARLIPEPDSSAGTVGAVREAAGAWRLTAPRRAWAAAQLAHEMARASKDDELTASCALTLAVTLNELGEFDAALPLAQLAAARLAGLRAAQAERQIAVAQQAFGRLGFARQALARARNHLPPDATVEMARCDLLEGDVCHTAGERDTAGALLQKARAILQERHETLELARCHQIEARRLAMSDPERARALAEQACQWCEEGRYPLELAHSQLALVDALESLNRYDEALAAADRAHDLFSRERSSFFAASANLYVAIILWRLHRYEEALAACEQAQQVFQSKPMEPPLMRCEINQANILYSLNRYPDALALYERAGLRAESLGRPSAAARCYENSALAYHWLGQYGRALARHRQAGDLFLQLGETTGVAVCEQNMARTCQALAQYDQALAQFRQAAQRFDEANAPVYAARCATHLGSLHLQLKQTGDAIACLEGARETFVANNLPSFTAVCDQLLALADSQAARFDKGLRRLAEARNKLEDRGQIVDSALCDLIAGDLHRTAGDSLAAENHFRTALSVLDPGFPDHAWRAEWGLARCQRQHGRAGAVANYRRAIHHLATPREELVTEALSSGYHRQRQALYEEALAFALDEDLTGWALEIVEASKARSFLSLLQRRGRPLRDDVAMSARVRSLLEKEQRLRGQIEEARARLYRSEPTVSAMRGDGTSRHDLNALSDLSRQYEDVVQDLRLAGAVHTGPSTAQPFSVDRFIRQATTRLARGWAGLAYFVTGSELTIFHLHEAGVEAIRKPLSAYDRHILQQCTDPDPTARELVYRGTIGGRPVPSRPGEKYRQHLGRLLIPNHVLSDAPQRLLIVPHGSLHHLPFHALLHGDTCLIERAPILFAPSLQALETLWAAPLSPADTDSALVCGLSDYGERAVELPHTRQEADLVTAFFNQRGQTLWGEEASRETLLRMSRAGELRQYGVIHFASHALLDPLSPWQSRILLADGDLTVVDVLDLWLDAALVVLSACQSGLGAVSSGDEVVSLARAFFLAGARQLLGTLWGAEDETTLHLMKQFYRHWRDGTPAVQALADSQRQMIVEGYSPFQWAPFVLVGTG